MARYTIRRRGLRVGRARYDLSYAFEGTPGQALLQEVETAIDVDDGAGLAISYRTTYSEWFRLGTRPVADLHDFAVRRDGWSRQDVEALVRRLAPGVLRRRPYIGRLTLSYRKRFVLSGGEIDGSPTLRRFEGGGAFGLLEQGPRGPGGGSIEVTFGGSTICEAIRLPSPRGLPSAGSGSFDQDERWRASEHFRYVERGGPPRFETVGYTRGE